MYDNQSALKALDNDTQVIILFFYNFDMAVCSQGDIFSAFLRLTSICTILFLIFGIGGKNIKGYVIRIIIRHIYDKPK